MAWTTSATGSYELWLWDGAGSITITAEDRAYIYGEGGGPVQLAASQDALALLLRNGGLLTWGSATSTAGCSQYRLPASEAEQLVEVAASDSAFAARDRTGRVVACGSRNRGGALPESLRSVMDGGAAGLVGSAGGAFAAWTTGAGRVFSWGSRRVGGVGSLSSLDEMQGVRKVWASEGAFAAVRNDGYVYTWGNCFYGGCLTGSRNAKGAENREMIRVAHVFSGALAFTALLPNQSVVAWGKTDRGGSITSPVPPSVPVSYAVSSRGATCVLSQSNTSLTCWGAANFGGDSSEASRALQDAGSVKIGSLVNTDSAFALLVGSTVLAWGDEAMGGLAPASLAEKAVVQLVASQGAFAALTLQGEVVVWGDPRYGGRLPEDWSEVMPGMVRRLVASLGGFLALGSTGAGESVAVAWGDGYGYPFSYARLSALLSPVNATFASLYVV